MKLSLTVEEMEKLADMITDCVDEIHQSHHRSYYDYFSRNEIYHGCMDVLKELENNSEKT